MFESLGGLSPAALVAEVEATYRQESMLVARRMAAVAALLRGRVAAAERVAGRVEHAEIDGFDQAKAEVAAAMNLSPLAASYLVSHAEALDVRLPAMAALLAQGRTDWRTVRLIIGRTVVTAELIARLDASLAESIGAWQGWSRQRIINAVDAAVRMLDPDAARERQGAAHADRHLGIRALENGMAEVYGTVEAGVATAFDRRLAQLAKQVCRGDGRTMDQRRADALGCLTDSRVLGCACGQPQCPRRSDTEGAGHRVVINVVASADTVYGTSSQPGYLQGYGVIDAEQVRDLVASAALQVINPATSPLEALRYQPSAALERAVRCRDLTCRFPGCARPAAICDLDHSIAFNHTDPAAGGLTVFENLKCLCRQHHRLKTFGGWRDEQLADGTVVWTSPSGHTYRTAPAGVDLFGPMRQPPCAPPIPNRRSRSAQRASRITRARKHNREQRPVNEYERWLARARDREIADRRFRNHMRDMLFVFKHTPSTSPFCRWVNDPREPEELPPDWTPNEPMPAPLPDEPPF
ncbi:HNH endonuclease signature motif containing protein [Mycobacterium szulgai]|uniref:HNH nuclease n=1 Tax=Mycobacterium szulgai TaxID=1787 RepID=A0A1X2EXH2_MYCSZ|nr:HNH endonuclease signature motif containing protein [Mycobacterium szulgai]MCV7077340.1 DUF222 domain-containing protein [Mycobacterium szulgai]ORX10873.1 HNH nuclease [Mycobacterium szulgai]